MASRKLVAHVVLLLVAHVVLLLVAHVVLLSGRVLSVVFKLPLGESVGSF
jgi:hypothetical protein